MDSEHANYVLMLRVCKQHCKEHPHTYLVCHSFVYFKFCLFVSFKFSVMSVNCSYKQDEK